MTEKKEMVHPKGWELQGAAGTDVSEKTAERAVNAIAKAEAYLAESVRKKAAGFVQDAVDTLGAFARGEEVNGVQPKDNTVRASARDIIEFAGGRPETRDPTTSDPSQQVHIYIQRFSDGKVVQAAMGGGEIIDVEAKNDPLAEAEKASSSVSKSYEFDSE